MHTQVEPEHRLKYQWLCNLIEPFIFTFDS